MYQRSTSRSRSSCEREKAQASYSRYNKCKRKLEEQEEDTRISKRICRKISTLENKLLKIHGIKKEVRVNLRKLDLNAKNNYYTGMKLSNYSYSTFKKKEENPKGKQSENQLVGKLEEGKLILYKKESSRVNKKYPLSIQDINSFIKKNTIGHDEIIRNKEDLCESLRIEREKSLPFNSIKDCTNESLRGFRSQSLPADDDGIDSGKIINNSESLSSVNISTKESLRKVKVNDIKNKEGCSSLSLDGKDLSKECMLGDKVKSFYENNMITTDKRTLKDFRNISPLNKKTEDSNEILHHDRYKLKNKSNQDYLQRSKSQIFKSINNNKNKEEILKDSVNNLSPVNLESTTDQNKKENYIKPLTILSVSEINKKGLHTENVTDSESGKEENLNSKVKVNTKGDARKPREFSLKDFGLKKGVKKNTDFFSPSNSIEKAKVVNIENQNSFRIINNSVPLNDESDESKGRKYTLEELGLSHKQICTLSLKDFENHKSSVYGFKDFEPTPLKNNSATQENIENNLRNFRPKDAPIKKESKILDEDMPETSSYNEDENIDDIGLSGGEEESTENSCIKKTNVSINSDCAPNIKNEPVKENSSIDVELESDVSVLLNENENEIDFDGFDCKSSRNSIQVVNPLKSMDSGNKTETKIPSSVVDTELIGGHKENSLNHSNNKLLDDICDNVMLLTSDKTNMKSKKANISSKRQRIISGNQVEDIKTSSSNKGSNTQLICSESEHSVDNSSNLKEPAIDNSVNDSNIIGDNIFSNSKESNTFTSNTKILPDTDKFNDGKNNKNYYEKKDLNPDEAIISLGKIKNASIDMSSNKNETSQNCTTNINDSSKKIQIRFKFPVKQLPSTDLEIQNSDVIVGSKQKKCSNDSSDSVDCVNSLPNDMNTNNISEDVEECMDIADTYDSDDVNEVVDTSLEISKSQDVFSQRNNISKSEVSIKDKELGPGSCKKDLKAGNESENENDNSDIQIIDSSDIQIIAKENNLFNSNQNEISKKDCNVKESENIKAKDLDETSSSDNKKSEIVESCSKKKATDDEGECSDSVQIIPSSKSCADNSNVVDIVEEKRNDNQKEDLNPILKCFKTNNYSMKKIFFPWKSQELESQTNNSHIVNYVQQSKNLNEINRKRFHKYERIEDCSNDFPKFSVLDTENLMHSYKNLVCGSCFQHVDVKFTNTMDLFGSEFEIKCFSCSHVKRFKRSKSCVSGMDFGSIEFDPLYLKLVFSCLDFGGGYNQLQSICLALNIPQLGMKSYNKYCGYVISQSEKKLDTILKVAHKIVHNVYENTGILVNDEGLREIKVIMDSWIPKGRRKKYGLIVVVDLLTGLVLDYHLLIKYCQKCFQMRKKDNFELWKLKHRELGQCHINSQSDFINAEKEVNHILCTRSEQKYKFKYVCVSLNKRIKETSEIECTDSNVSSQNNQVALDIENTSPDDKCNTCEISVSNNIYLGPENILQNNEDPSESKMEVVVSNNKSGSIDTNPTSSQLTISDKINSDCNSNVQKLKCKKDQNHILEDINLDFANLAPPNSSSKDLFEKNNTFSEQEINISPNKNNIEHTFSKNIDHMSKQTLNEQTISPNTNEISLVAESGVSTNQKELFLYSLLKKNIQEVSLSILNEKTADHKNTTADVIEKSKSTEDIFMDINDDSIKKVNKVLDLERSIDDESFSKTADITFDDCENTTVDVVEKSKSTEDIFMDINDDSIKEVNKVLDLGRSIDDESFTKTADITIDDLENTTVGVIEKSKSTEDIFMDIIDDSIKEVNKVLDLEERSIDDESFTKPADISFDNRENTTVGVIEKSKSTEDIFMDINEDSIKKVNKVLDLEERAIDDETFTKTADIIFDDRLVVVNKSESEVGQLEKVDCSDKLNSSLSYDENGEMASLLASNILDQEITSDDENKTISDENSDHALKNSEIRQQTNQDTQENYRKLLDENLKIKSVEDFLLNESSKDYPKNQLKLKSVEDCLLKESTRDDQKNQYNISVTEKKKGKEGTAKEDLSRGNDNSHSNETVLETSSTETVLETNSTETVSETNSTEMTCTFLNLGKTSIKTDKKDNCKLDCSSLDTSVLNLDQENWENTEEWTKDFETTYTMLKQLKKDALHSKILKHCNTTGPLNKEFVEFACNQAIISYNVSVENIVSNSVKH